MLDIIRRCTYILCMMNNTIRPEEVYELVEAIPAGFVATYGQLAFLLERPRQSRMVGRALSHVPPGLSLPATGWSITRGGPLRAGPNSGRCWRRREFLSGVTAASTSTAACGTRLTMKIPINRTLM